MDEAFTYDHYLDLEIVPDGALDASGNSFLAALYQVELEVPQR